MGDDGGGDDDRISSSTYDSTPAIPCGHRDSINGETSDTIKIAGSVTIRGHNDSINIGHAGDSDSDSYRADSGAGAGVGGGEADAGPGTVAGDETTALVAKAKAAEHKKEASYGTFAGYAITVNYMIGTGVFPVLVKPPILGGCIFLSFSPFPGVFGLPYAFFSGGIALTTILLFLFAGFLTLTAFWVLEIMARTVGYTKRAGTTKHVPNELTEKCDFTKFCFVFGGMPGKVICQVVMAFYVYGALWAYVASFASTLSMLIFEYAVPGDEVCNYYEDPSSWCTFAYYGSILLYLCIVLPLTLMDLAEQAVLQMFLTIYRFFAFGLMVITVLVAIGFVGQYSEPKISSSSSSFDQGNIWGFKWSGFGTAFTSTAFALTMHYNLPNSLSPVRNKLSFRTICLCAIFTAIFFYFTVGCSCGYFFNEYTEPLVVLNWEGYTGRDGGWGEGSALWWSYIIQLLIMIFPIINLANDFPLVAITLGSNLDQFVPKRFTGTATRARIARIIVRLICVFPPIIAGALLGELDKIFTFTGLFAFVLVFFIPAIFQFISKRALVKKYGPGSDWTPYSGWYSHDFFVILTLVVGIIAFGVAIADTIISMFGLEI
ncbi:Transmembrane protein [Pelomyxa schiedti]|nr:Transmembrane protein [Pelomyxa schiedti]